VKYDTDMVLTGFLIITHTAQMIFFKCTHQG